MRFTFILNKENEKYIKSIKGHGESVSSSINRAIEQSRKNDEILKKLDYIILKLDENNE